MPRTARKELAGGIHHVTTRGNCKQTIFHDDRDRACFLGELASAAREHRWLLLAYCLMGNHFHLVVETPEMTLGDGMGQLAGNYAQWFNRRRARSGRFYQDRYWNKLVRSDEQFAQLLRYVALNPVAAGWCADPSAWRWSGHRELMASDAPKLVHRDRVEQLLEAWGGRAGSRYARLFEAGNALADRFGSESPWTYRPPLDELLSSADLDEGMRAAREHGYRNHEIAAVVGLHPTTVSRRIRSVSSARKGTVPFRAFG